MDVESRTISEARYIADTRCTLRQCAARFNVGKSTVHVDMTKRLPELDGKMWVRVSKILNYNGKTKHIRGGQTTKNRYAEKNKRKNDE